MAPWSKRPYSFLYRLLQKIWTWTVVYWISECQCAFLFILLFVLNPTTSPPPPNTSDVSAYHIMFSFLDDKVWHVTDTMSTWSPPRLGLLQKKLFLTNIWQKFYNFKCDEHHGWKTWCEDSLYVKCQTHSLPRSQEHLWLEIIRANKGCFSVNQQSETQWIHDSSTLFIALFSL